MYCKMCDTEDGIVNELFRYCLYNIIDCLDSLFPQ